MAMFLRYISKTFRLGLISIHLFAVIQHKFYLTVSGKRPKYHPTSQFNIDKSSGLHEII